MFFHRRSSRSSWLRWPTAVLCGWLLCLPLYIAAADGQLEMRSLYTTAENGVYRLNGKLVFQLPEGAQQAVQEGVTLNLTLEILVHRSRRLWLDETIAELEQHYAVSYHAVSERYVVRNMNSGEQNSYPTLSAALESLSTLQDLPILDTALVSNEERNEISVRANLEVRSIPRALGILLFWINNWRQTSDWYTWPLNA